MRSGPLKHKGYYGFAEYIKEARIFHGEVLAVDAVITFQGTSIDEVEKAFKESVDDYLKWCQQDLELHNKKIHIQENSTESAT